MVVDRHKLVLALSTLWVLASMPISENLYNEVWGSGLFMRIFALVIVATPVWLLFGLKWLTNGTPVSRMNVTIILGVGAALTVWALNDRYWNNVAYIPVVAAIIFALLVIVEQWKALPKDNAAPSSTGHFDAEKLAKLEQMNHKVTPLLRLTETVANDVHQHIKTIGSPSPLPGIINSDADATKAAYGLIHSAYVSCLTSDRGSAAAMVLAMYQSHMVSNLTALMMPRMPGMPTLTPQELQDERFRTPIRQLMKIEEDNGISVRRNLAQKAPHPFLPLYENLRPYVSPRATPEQLSVAFEDKFAALYELIKGQVSKVVIQS